MKQIFFTLVVLFISAFTMFAQQDEYKSADDLLLEGAKHYNNKDYEEAFVEFSKINYNDTAYFELTLNALQSAVEINKVDTILEISTKILGDPRNNPLKERFVILKGYALLEQEKFEETLEFYGSYLGEFSQSSVIHYNRSVALYSLDKFDEAITALQTSIRFNPRNEAAHTKLGLICAEAEDYTKAALCLNMALFLSPADDKSVTLLATLEDIYDRDFEKNIGKINYREDEDFQEIDELIANKIAENKGYKIGVKLPFKLFKYNHMVFEQMEYDESSDGFWNQNYVRFFKEIMNRNQFPYFCYYECLKVDNPKVQKTIVKNKVRITNFLKDAGVYFTEFMNERSVWDGENYVENILNHYGRYGYNISVQKNDGVQSGPYTGYSNTGLVEAEGTLDSEGKQDGLWKFYDEDGVLQITSEFKAGKLAGTRTTYYKNGSREQAFNVVDGEISGNIELFTAYNQLRRQIPYSDGKENGTLIAYYNTGETYLKREYVDGKLNGETIKYYSNGDVMAKELYEDGEQQGDYKELYRGGADRTVGQYTDGSPSGHWKYLHKNGQIKEEGDFKNGYRVGVWKEFAKNGKLVEESNFGETGKKVGVYKEYDLDENLILELTYKGEEITSYKTYDDKGGILSEGEKKRKELEFENYYTNGQLRAKGNYYKGNRVGLWKYYNEYGVLTSEEPHDEEGLLEGEVRNYFDNGQLETTIIYKEGSRNGLFEDFYRNGALYKRGFMIDGQAVGEWKFYYRDGMLKSSDYYMDGELNGNSVHYDKKGRLNEISTYFSDVLQTIQLFDTTGAILSDIKLKDGKYENIEFLNVGGKVTQRKTYDGAEVNGESISYYGSGAVKSKGIEIDGLNHGLWEWYYENGQVETSGTYDFDRREGDWTWYHENGQIDVVLNYQDGNAEGKRLSYYKDGTLFSESFYRNDEIHGQSTYYDESGQVLVIRYYKDGRMLGYSYHGADNKPVEMIPFNNQNGSMEAFFPNGKKSYFVEYKDGYKQGKSIEYHSNGKEAIVRFHEKGQLNGERTQYYPSGKIKVMGSYFYGDRQDVRTSYYENGKVKSIENYISGTLFGRAIYYKKDGSVDREVEYYSGSQIK